MKKLLILLLCFGMLTGCGGQKERDGLPVYGMGKAASYDKEPYTWKLKVVSVEVDEDYYYLKDNKKAIIVTFECETTGKSELFIGLTNFILYKDGKELEDTFYSDPYTDKAEDFVLVDEDTTQKFAIGFIVDEDINECEIRYRGILNGPFNFILDINW